MAHKRSRRCALGALVCLAFLSASSSDGFASDDRAGGSVIAHDPAPCAATSSPGSARSSARSAALSEAINQNTPGKSQGYPAGLAWDKGVYGTTALKPAPAGFSALTGWGVVYRAAGEPVSPSPESDTVEIADFTTYVHLTSGTWVKVQDQRWDGITGGHYIADFSNDDHIPLPRQTLADGSESMAAPPAGYNDHFWPKERGTFTPGTVDGVFIETKMRTNHPQANLVAQIGADWWLNATADFVAGFDNNPPVGGNNFIKLTAQWQTLYYTSLGPQALEANPPDALLSAPQACR